MTTLNVLINQLHRANGLADALKFNYRLQIAPIENTGRVSILFGSPEITAKGLATDSILANVSCDEASRFVSGFNAALGWLPFHSVDQPAKAGIYIDPEETNIAEVSTDDTGGCLYIDKITLKNGKIISVSQESVNVYANENDFEENDELNSRFF